MAILKPLYIVFVLSLLVWVNASDTLEASSVSSASTKKEACKKALFKLTNNVASQAGIEVSSKIEISKSSLNGTYSRNVKQKQTNKVSKIVQILSKQEETSYNNASGMIECKIKATVKVSNKTGKFSYIITSLKDEVVYDRKAKVEWVDNFTAFSKRKYKKDWDFAYNFCKNINHNNKQDWRLPSKLELANTSSFYHKFAFSKTNSYYWSGTTKSDKKAYSVGFIEKNNKIFRKIKINNKNRKRYIRCIRDNAS